MTGVLLASLWTYGGGTPRYLGMWLVLTPVLLAGLWAFGVRRPVPLGVAFVATLPSLSRNPPSWWVPPLRSWVLGLLYLAVALWLASHVLRARTRGGDTATSARSPLWGWAVVGLVGLALALRVPLAWWDPGISQIGTSTEIAANQLLDGDNPYPLPNPDADYGTYQYPAGTLLLHTPFVALVPDDVLGEDHLGVRLTIWLAEAAAVVFLAWAGRRLGRPRAGLAAAFAYAVCPTLVRETGMTVSNDVLLALGAAGCAVALARRRPVLAGALAGAAIAIKPAAALLVPLVWAAVGWRAAAAAVAVPAVLQLPFLLWPTPSLHALRAITEPASRAEPLPVLRADSLWWPLYSWVGGGEGVIRAVAYLGLAIGIALAVWVGLEIRRQGPAIERCLAAVALPLFVAFALASVQRTNYQDWYLTAALLLVGLTVRERSAPGAGAPEPG